MKNLFLATRSINVTWLPNNRYYIKASLLLIWFFLGVLSLSQAQVYYTLYDGTPTTQVDQLRLINLNGTGDALIKDNFVQTAGPLVLDAANNRLLVVDMRTSQPST
ncbi:hypothetical protein IC230_12345, partial [Spirosoma sp. BT704]|nr:hypothetical protein [Spirosoma validum]